MTATSKSLEDLAELAPGRGFTESTDTPDWVILTASSPAVKLYALLRMRLNRKRRDRKVWPGRAALAVALDVKKTDTVSGYLKELEELGAIDVERTKTVPSFNIYRVNHAPPEGFAGHRVMEEWDRDRAVRDRIEVIRQAERDKRDRAKAKTKSTVAPVKAKAQVSLDTPPNGYLAGTAETGLSDTPPNGYLDTPPNGDLGTRSNGSKPLGVTEVLEITVSPTSSTSSTEEEKEQDPISPEIEDQETAAPVEPQGAETIDDVKDKAFWPELTTWEFALVEECMTHAGARWSSGQVRKVIGSRTVREVTARDPELVWRAFVIGAKSRQGITVPMRMWYLAECPHWRTAERELANERAPETTGADAEAALDQEPAGKAPQLVAAPSSSQESTKDDGVTFRSAEEAREHARREIAAGRERAAAKNGAPAPRSHRDTMTMLDNVINEEAGVA